MEGGLSAAITDEPPAGTYVVAGHRVNANKAKVGAAVLVAGVVAAAVAVAGSNTGSAPVGGSSTVGLTQSTGTVTFPVFDPVVTTTPPCSCTDGLHIAAQCEDLKVLITGNTRPLPYQSFAGYLDHWTREDLAGGNVTWTFTCKDTGVGSRAGFIASARACDNKFATHGEFTQFASDAEAPPFYFYADTSSYPGNVANPEVQFSQGDILVGGSPVSYEPSGFSAGSPILKPPHADWVWDNSARGTPASPRTVVFKFTAEHWDTCAPSLAPTSAPTRWPTAPTETPTSAPTRWPTAPTESPSAAPTSPTSEPTAHPTEHPTEQPTEPTASPTMPTSQPTQPTSEPTTAMPTSAPSQAPSETPTEAPTSPTSEPTAHPTEQPTEQPTEPTASPTSPTSQPTQPTSEPTTAIPTNAPSQGPSKTPTETPTPPILTNSPVPPSADPTTAPTAPSVSPSVPRPPSTAAPSAATKWPTKLPSKPVGRRA